MPCSGGLMLVFFTLVGWGALQGVDGLKNVKSRWQRAIIILFTSDNLNGISLLGLTSTVLFSQ